ncbi:MAG: NUDIX hydrolase [Thermoplasmata archaeon]|nr:NUDIX hydrolase [Thermoplasmata archaeon]
MSAAGEFPDRPVLAVGAIVFRGESVLLVKRAAEPNKGRWSVPGGALEVGETVKSGAVRETREETGVSVRPLRVLDAVDFIEREAQRIRWHYVIVDVLCEYERGEPSPATDAVNARFLPLRELAEYDIPAAVLQIVSEAAKSRGSSEPVPDG